MEGEKLNQHEAVEQWNLQVEVKKLKENGFEKASIYLENPELVDQLRLNDILALNEILLRGGIRDKFLFNGGEIDPNAISSLTVQATNKLRELLPDPEKPLTLEDAFLIVATHTQRQTPNERITSPNPRMASVNKQYLDPGMACGFFHTAYFFSPFPEHRKPGDIYASPVAFIEKVLSTEQETPENVNFAERIMKRLMQFYNTELRRQHYYYNVLFPRGRAIAENLDGDEKAKIAESVKIDLKGYNGQLLKKGDGKARDFPSQGFRYDIEQALHAFVRPLYGTHTEGPEQVMSLARMKNTPLAKILAEKFREIARENPPQYFDPPYTQDWLTQPLD